MSTHDAHIPNPPHRRRVIIRVLKILPHLLILLFGIATTLSLSYKWMAMAFLLYSLPLFCQISRHPLVRLYATTFGIVLVSQSLLSPLIMDLKPKTLRPFLNRTWDIQSGLPGVRGIQHVTTDLKGFRVTKSIDYQRPAPYRIFAIGASTTEQMFLDDRNTWTHQLQVNLEKDVPGIEVINTGLSGTRSSQNYAVFADILKYHPDMVIFNVGMNDAYYHILTHFDMFYPYSFDRTALGRSLRHYLEYWTASVEEPNQKENVLVVNGSDFAYKQNSLARSTVKQFRPNMVSDSYAANIDKFIRICETAPFACVFMTQPTGYRDAATDDFKRGFWMTPAEARYTLDFQSMVHISKLYNDFIVQIGDAHGIPVIDLVKDIQPSYDYLYDDAHFNLNGAKEIGRILADRLLPIISARNAGLVSTDNP
jgi:lysophospholipase L1-like esterase